MNGEIAETQKEQAGFLEVMRAVFWSFFGVRSSKGRKSDETRIGPWQVFIAGWIGAAVVVAILVGIVKIILP
ncbi:DUF2970 domain-containing protein [Stenotrophobium rhamnosiphilum]|uniref:DUF2970 domain-containing protein n=1 Tax=Stenotrophobium rhamnosiphilum TaxID=2029166 RepID=A0A2T5MFW3_9GAMM|nr:DUF2970 domain-containing protein [Stenotrophobium rhamnosiphilum]PTU31467.1 hypothetical protein CJD38_09005 [Stenotrophobium rhamnosiphilum]